MLDEYQNKRNFDSTSEPAPEVDTNSQNRFVVQEHNATNLHWDFRLELDGVLKSWAVPKGPPLKSGIRRLAVQTEDHPVAYLAFEGTIPEGQYGAGDVKIWDSGTFDLEHREEGKYTFTLHGEKMKDGYALIHTNDKNWILLKRKQ